MKDKDGNVQCANRRLTDANINKLQNYYGKAIRANIGNESTKQACWAVFYHSGSHDENQQHDYHPKDKDSVVSS